MPGESAGDSEQEEPPHLTRRRLIRLGSGVAGAGALARVFLIRPDIPVERLRDEYTTAASRFVDVGDATVHVRDEGPRDAPAVVLIHGFGSSLHAWNGWVKRLDDEFRFVTLTLPGFGLTGPNDSGEYSQQYWVELVHGLVQQLGIDRFAIGGNSMGGEVAWRYALDHPGRVERLVLVDAAGYETQDGDEPLLLTLGSYPVVGLVPRYVMPRVAIRQALASAWGDPATLTTRLVRRYHRLLLRAGNRDAILTMLQSPDTSRADEISSIDVPTLVLWGERDTWIPPESAAQFRADIPDVTLVTYPELGHVPMEEAPAETAPDVASFLSG